MINILTILLLFFGSIVYSIIEGIREGYYYYACSMAPENDLLLKNKHPLFQLQRATVFVFLLISCLITLKFGYFFAVGCFFMFPFWHDGAYYVTQNKLNPKNYPKGWWDYSTKSNALFNLNVLERIIFFITGVIMLIISLILGYE